MKRRAFDLIASMIGLGLGIILLIAGGLLTYAHVYVANQVKTQLSDQQITMPGDPSKPATGCQTPANENAEPTCNFPDDEYTAADAAALQKFAGQMMTNGKQAQAYANHYLGAHLRMIGGGQVQNGEITKPGVTYSHSTNDAQKATLFQGETLRGLLLNAYAFGTMGDIAGLASIFAYIFGGIMLILGVLGLLHRRRVSPDQEVGVGRAKAEGSEATSDAPAS